MDSSAYLEGEGGIPRSASPDENAVASSQNPFSCNICKRSYTRLDHLARHFRSHTNEKPFTCDVCNKSFARVDLLKRHAINHSNDQPNKRLKTSQNGPRSRTAKACIACAESKLRCGPSRPCDRCKARGIPCEFHEARKAAADDSTACQGVSIDDSVVLGIDSYQGISVPSPVQAGFNQDEMQAASSLQQMPTTQYVSPRNDRTDEFPSITPFQSNQVTTPSTFDQGPSMPMSSPFMNPGTIMPFDDMMMADFLRDVMTPMPAAAQVQNLPDFSYSLPHNFLDFGFDSTFDFPNMLSGPPVALDYPPLPTSRDGELTSHTKTGASTPRGNQLEAVNLGQQAFKQSVWLWTPAVGDHVAAEQQFLSLPNNTIMPEDQSPGENMFKDSMTLASRDRVLVMVLSCCEASVQGHVVACFPSADFMTRAINNFMAFHKRQEYTWIHSGTVRLNDECHQLLAAFFCAGAVLSKIPEVRRVGLAIQETLRTALADQFENDNRNIRKLKLLQAYALNLDVGLWSGNRRKMEIAESFSLPVITMLRRAGSFSRPRKPESKPDPRDDAVANEAKWQTWVEAESLKRLALYFLIRDMHCSMSLLVQPVMSWAETSLDSPSSRELWEASNAEEWRRLYLEQVTKSSISTLPSIRTLINDTSLIGLNQEAIDVRMTVAVVATSIWALVWQFRQHKIIEKSHTGVSSRPASNISNSLYQECKQLTQYVSLNSMDWDVEISPQSDLERELSLLHLHVGLEDIQLFAGKAGVEESRRALPALRTWQESQESRQAIFHAGQVIRAARQYPTGMLQGFAAVAVYHAALTMWAWAIMEDYPRQQESAMRSWAGSRMSLSSGESSVFRLDVADNSELQRFLVLGKGIPAIGAANADSRQKVLLSDPHNLMNTIQAILMNNTVDASEKGCPSLVSNLSKLLYSLGKAAAGVLKR